MTGPLCRTHALVFDPDDMAAQYFLELLRGATLNADRAGEEDALQAQRADVVFIGAEENGEGLAIADELRSRGEAAPMVVVVSAGLPRATLERHAARALGADAYLRKPYRERALRQVVDAAQTGTPLSAQLVELSDEAIDDDEDGIQSGRLERHHPLHLGRAGGVFLVARSLRPRERGVLTVTTARWPADRLTRLHPFWTVRSEPSSENLTT